MKQETRGLLSHFNSTCEQAKLQVRWPSCKYDSVCRWSSRLDSGQTEDFKVGIHNLRLNAQQETEWRTNPQVYLLCRWERHLAGFPHLGVVDSWPVTRISELIIAF